MKPTTRTFASQPCWVLRSNTVELAITHQGGHMAPVRFACDRKTPIEPYYISPWQDEGRSIDEPVLVPLRGDFFCLPFGANTETYRGVNARAHGEPAGARWTFVSEQAAGDVHSLTLAMETEQPAGRCTKTLTLIDGQNIIYVKHVLEGYSGKMPLGHHATLAVDESPGSLLVTTSPFQLGMTAPSLFSDPAEREYQSLAIGKRFKSLSKVPTLWTAPCQADCTSYPARTGFTDLLAVFKHAGRRPAWTAAVHPRKHYLWFALKDVSILPSTVLWISNRGRHGSPWDGRNRCLGIEDVCAYFADGLKSSARANEVNQAGFATAVSLSRSKPTVVPYIQGCVPVPAQFDRVAGARFEPGRVRFRSESGKTVDIEVNYEYLMSGEL